VLGCIEGRFDAIELGEAEVILTPSPHDPWHEVEVVRVLGAVYARGTLVLGAGKVVAEATPSAFLPYSRLKVD
jgi:acetoacetate decarboxylase